MIKAPDKMSLAEKEASAHAAVQALLKMIPGPDDWAKALVIEETLKFLMDENNE